MELQNIVFDFNDLKVYSLFEDEPYDIDNVSNLEALKSAMDLQESFLVERAVVQYTKDQSGSVPRIVFSGEEQNVNIVNIADLNEAILTQLTISRNEVEAEITAQNN